MKKVVLIGVLALVYLVGYGQANAALGKPSFRLSEKGLEILDEGKPGLVIGRLLFSWRPPKARPARVVREWDGGMEVACEVTDDTSGRVKAMYKAEATPTGVEVHVTVEAPQGLETKGMMIEIKGGDVPRDICKVGVWTRHAGGGVPYEVKDRYLRRFAGLSGGRDWWYTVSGNSNWGRNDAENLPLKETIVGADGLRTLTGTVIFTGMPVGMTGEVAAAWTGGRPLVVEAGTGHSFNIYKEGKPAVVVTVWNAGMQSRTGVPLQVTGYDFDGRTVLSEQRKLDLGPWEKCSMTLEMDTKGASRGLWFVEAKAGAGGQEVFTRTTVALLPPYVFKHRDESIFGMAAFFNLPSREDVFKLMERMGVRHLRNTDSREAARYGMVGNYHKDAKPRRSAYTDEQSAQVAGMLKEYHERQNAAFEFCNEWNMGVKAEDVAKVVSAYLSWVHEIERRRRSGEVVQLLTMGLAGVGESFQREIARQGGWGLFDGVAIHPGRGNVTPDDDGPGWTYLGALRRQRQLFRELGEKPLYLTEVYACTQANNWWVDSERQAAENTMLTLAIGLAEGVKALYFYQMHNAVWFDRGGVRHTDREFDFGLLHRDNSPKPSLMAYAATAEALDGAKFVRWLGREGTQLRGLLFETPAGPLAMLWDRTDGTVQSEKSPDFVHCEPWVDMWKSRTQYRFAAAGAKVTVGDCLGRKTEMAAKDGSVELELTGAPLMVWGLDWKEQ